MAKVFLMQQYQGRTEDLGAVFPLGLAYLAAALTEKHEVQVFDPNLYENPYDLLAERLNRFAPDVVGISIRNIDNLEKRNLFFYFQTVAPTIDIIKKNAPAARIVGGGSGFSIFAEAIMERFPQIDFGVYLEGEESFAELLESLDKPADIKGIFYRDGHTCKFTGPRPLPDFARLPMPNRQLFDMPRYTNLIGNIGVQTKRGCPLKCVYCSYPFLNGNRIRFRRPEHVVDEIEQLVNEFGINEFMFVDGVFNSPMKQAVAICEEIIRRDLKVNWSAWCDIRNFTPEFIDVASRAGCAYLPFSPDGATDACLAALGKGIRAADIDRTLKLLRHYKHIRSSFSFFPLPPQQTYLGLMKTLWLYVKINLLLLGRGSAFLSWIRIEPHTGIYEIALNEGLITRDTDLLPGSCEEVMDLFYVHPTMKLGESLTMGFLNLTGKISRLVFRRRRHHKKRAK